MMSHLLKNMVNESYDQKYMTPIFISPMRNPVYLQQETAFRHNNDQFQFVFVLSKPKIKFRIDLFVPTNILFEQTNFNRPLERVISPNKQLIHLNNSYLSEQILIRPGKIRFIYFSNWPFHATVYSLFLVIENV